MSRTNSRSGISSDSRTAVATAGEAAATAVMTALAQAAKAVLAIWARPISSVHLRGYRGSAHAPPQLVVSKPSATVLEALNNRGETHLAKPVGNRGSKCATSVERFALVV